MSTAIFPIAFQSEEIRLLTAVVLGFLFGFSLERAGFGNARKLAAQFYLYDMTVFKVMFTAILVAMVGLYTLISFGMVDLSMMWINPTFMWAQVIGGFLLGVGFIMSGLCPGTSVVSAASGRWDGLVAFIGISIGLALFIFTVDSVPGMLWLYQSGSMGVSILPELFGIPAPLFALGVVVMAAAAFVGAEKVEKIFQQRHRTLELAPRPKPRLKFALAGAFAVVAVVAFTMPGPTPEAVPTPMTEMEPLVLAEEIISGNPDLLVLDLRVQVEELEARVPGAYPTAPDSSALALLATAGPYTTVVVYDESGDFTHAPANWPHELKYYYLRGGFSGWNHDVLTPLEMEGFDLDRRELVQRQNQIAAFFSGAAVQSASAAAPLPAMPAGGAKKKKKAGGC